MVIFLVIAGVILLVLYYGFFLLPVGAMPAGFRKMPVSPQLMSF